MAIQSGMGTSGIVAIPIPPGGNPGDVLTKDSTTSYDYSWQPSAGGGAPTNAEYVTLALDATLTDERVLTAGTGISIVDGGPNTTVTISVNTATLGYTLQDAYDAAPAVPQITVNNAQPVTIDLTAAANDAFAIRDEADVDLLRVSDVDFDTTGLQHNIDAALTNGNPSSITLTDTTSVGAFVGGGIQSTGTITYTATTFIWALLQESKGYLANSPPAFAAFTLFNAIPFIRNGTNNSLVQSLVLNVGVSHQSTGANAVTVTQSVGMSFAANTRALTAGGSMTKTVGDIAVNVAPTFGTVAGSSISFGTITGLRMRNPAVALFQPSAGIETMTAYVGVEIDAIPFGGNVTKRGIRSNLAAASNTRFIDGVGTAQSDLRGQLNFPADLTGVTWGASGDWSTGWAAGGFQFEQQNTGAIEQWRKSFPAAGRMLFDWSNDMELTINCIDGFSLGAQSGANGNQFGNFVTSARTIPVGGDWADFLLTQAGSLTVGGLAMGRVSAWVINPVSYANSTGSVGNADTLTVGGFPTSSPGVTITDRQSLFVIAGRSRFASAMQYDQESPSTLAAGNNNDYGGLLTGTANNGMRHWVRLTGDGGGTSVITGIDATAAQGGDCFKLTNVGTPNITLGHQDANSSAANRIISPTGANYLLGADESCEIIYDDVTSRWRIIYGTGA